jgi:hypothetical protein
VVAEQDGIECGAVALRIMGCAVAGQTGVVVTSTAVIADEETMRTILLLYLIVVVTLSLLLVGTILKCGRIL